MGGAAAQGTVCGQTRRVGRSGTACGRPRERRASVRYAPPPGALAPRGGAPACGPGGMVLHGLAVGRRRHGDGNRRRVCGDRGDGRARGAGGAAVGGAGGRAAGGGAGPGAGAGAGGRGGGGRELRRPGGAPAGVRGGAHAVHGVGVGGPRPDAPARQRGRGSHRCRGGAGGVHELLRGGAGLHLHLRAGSLAHRGAHPGQRAAAHVPARQPLHRLPGADGRGRRGDPRAGRGRAGGRGGPRRHRRRGRGRANWTTGAGTTGGATT